MKIKLTKKKIVRSRTRTTSPKKKFTIKTNATKKLREVPLGICNICEQNVFDVSFRRDRLYNYKKEVQALADQKLSLLKETMKDLGKDEYMTYKVTLFSIYDKYRHFCTIESGLIERGIPLYFCGLISPVYEEDPVCLMNGIPAENCGPITEWWTCGYDGGNKLFIGVTTKKAAYYLLQPSREYAPFYNPLHEKTELSRIVIQFLLDKYWENPVYEDLVQQVKRFEKYSNAEDVLLDHVRFICQQAMRYNEESPKEERPLITLSCMKTLIKISGVRIERPMPNNRNHREQTVTTNELQWSKPVVATDTVKDIFKNFFTSQVYEARNSNQKVDGNPTRNSSSSGILDDEALLNEVDSEENDEPECEKTGDDFEEDVKTVRITHNFSKMTDMVAWDIIAEMEENNNYSSAIIGDITVKVGDHVFLKPEDPDEVNCIAKIIIMFENSEQGCMFHGEFLCRSKDSILGETGDPKELFLVHDCEDLPLKCVVGKAEVKYIKPTETRTDLRNQVDCSSDTYFVCKKFLNHRFEDVEVESLKNGVCCSCRYKTLKNIMYEPSVVDEKCVQWNKENFYVGGGVFLTPGVHSFPFDLSEDVDLAANPTFINDVIQPEYYRKKLEEATPIHEINEPFTIGLIEAIETIEGQIHLHVRIFYRPENTINGMFLAHKRDLNCVYYTEKVQQVSFEKVAGKCYLTYGNNLDFLRKWSKEGPYRFYFMEMYDTENDKYVDVPEKAHKVGNFDIPLDPNTEHVFEIPPDWRKPDQPLKCLDIFAGCGGLSEGLHKSGLIDTKWAIEINPVTANAYRQNFPCCKVITEDCNVLLDMLLSGDVLNEIGLPEKGDVEILIAGPPCQGFSAMNRFSSGEYSTFQNSLIMTFLSYCEFYRPKYIVFENVRNFVSFNQGIVLKLTLRCLLALGYQVTYGILQAGQYGIPQGRRRFILMASSPNNPLPNFPEPLNVFSKQGNRLNYIVDNWKYDNGCYWIDSAPYRMISVRDALTDLPDIENGDNESHKTYESGPVSHYQYLMREESGEMLRDHICKKMSPIVLERIRKIPCYPGADWRDLPNIPHRLPDGTLLQPLKYSYRAPNQDTDEIPRGVCFCATGGLCNGADRQTNTLIPWSLPHTADRNNHWSGIYGRLEWGGYFRTTVTNPEPMGKQGRVIHPEQNRVVSVRECARSQGFPDKFIFSGNILEKHRQVGNAVPPPLATALGREICKVLFKYSEQ